MNPTASAVAFARAVRLLKLVQQLDRPGQPRNRVALAKRVKRRAAP